MPSVPVEHVLPARVLAEDDEFITIEVAKHDGVTFHLQQNDEGETVGGDRFLTMLFIHKVDSGKMASWLPWEGGG